MNNSGKLPLRSKTCTSRCFIAPPPTASNKRHTAALNEVEKRLNSASIIADKCLAVPTASAYAKLTSNQRDYGGEKTMTTHTQPLSQPPRAGSASGNRCNNPHPSEVYSTRVSFVLFFCCRLLAARAARSAVFFRFVFFLSFLIEYEQRDYC